MKNTQIQYIPIKDIHPHQRNPRRDLGDLTELAESIRANGVMQNLTVVRQEEGLCGSCKQYDAAAAKCLEEDIITQRPPCSNWKSGGKYTAVIGHRRLAASKLAGLEEVPCIVAEMTMQQQVSTMLLENMQRSDLTPVEQAQGFQMMLDLGETVQTIAEKTGFGETTVRHRIEIAKLNADGLKQAQGSGATIQDYIELEKIKDIETRNKVLLSIGTKNFRWEVERAIDAQKSAENRAKTEEVLNSFATRIEERYDNLTHVEGIIPSQAPAQRIKKPEDLDEFDYYYMVGSYSGAIYKLKKGEEPADDPKDEDQEQREREERAERVKQLNELAERAYELRRAFAEKVSATTAKKYLKEIVVAMITLGSDYDIEDALAVLGMDEEDKDKQESYEERQKRQLAAAKGLAEKSPERMMFLLVYGNYDRRQCGYHDRWSGKHMSENSLNDIYELLCALGYQMSDEEQQLKDGTHELFIKKEVADE